MKILVIGGTGFIGRHVVRRLSDTGHHVTVLHRGSTTAGLPDGVETIAGDRHRLNEHRAALAASRPDVVVDIILGSATQARALVEAFRGVTRRLVIVSSMDVYRSCGVLHGLEPGGLEPMPLTEQSALRTGPAYPPESVRRLQSVFTWLDDEYDKVRAERVLLSDPAVEATIVRLPMVYGPGDPLHRLYPLLKRMDDGRPAILLPEALARWRGSKGYVENVAGAIALAATSDRGRGRVYNVAEPETLTELEWARRLAATTGWAGDIVSVPPARTPAHLTIPGNFDQHWVASSERIRRELGYRETVPVDEALRRTVAWERAHPPAIDPAQFDYRAEDAALAS